MHQSHQNNVNLKLNLASLGVVYGDIGTSPLYALKLCFSLGGLTATAPNVLGIMSLIIWVLIAVVCTKYLRYVLRVQDHGDGGILVLTHLAQKSVEKMAWRRFKRFPYYIGIAGACLFFSDGFITPAISILSAAEGLKLYSPHFEPYILWLSGGAMVLLFALQSKGSEYVGSWFGPIMVIWFAVIGGLGLWHVVGAPEILMALNPLEALRFSMHHGWLTCAVLGGVFFVVTGCESLYADLGHFGDKVIRQTWFWWVFPSLLVTYMGQGALLLTNPSAVTDPFYHMAPDWALIPMILLASCATFIASQAIISGIFSSVAQMVRMNYLPKMRVFHTSHKEIGQVYIPFINWLLFTLTISIMIAAGTSDNLAHLYGLSVACVMLATSILFVVVSRIAWKWSLGKTLLIAVPFIVLDIIFVGANSLKILEGAWITLVLMAALMVIILTWIKGSAIVAQQKERADGGIGQYLDQHLLKHSMRLPGIAVFMTPDLNYIPTSLRVHIKHNTYLHERIVLMSIVTTKVPRVVTADKYTITPLQSGIFSVEAKFGFMETPDLNKVMDYLSKHYDLKSDSISYFFSHSVAVPTANKGLSLVGEYLYSFMTRLALPAYEFYKPAHSRLSEVGVRYTV